MSTEFQWNHASIYWWSLSVQQMSSSAWRMFQWFSSPLWVRGQKGTSQASQRAPACLLLFIVSIKRCGKHCYRFLTRSLDSDDFFCGLQCTVPPGALDRFVFHSHCCSIRCVQPWHRLCVLCGASLVCLDQPTHQISRNCIDSLCNKPLKISVRTNKHCRGASRSAYPARNEAVANQAVIAWPGVHCAVYPCLWLGPEWE